MQACVHMYALLTKRRCPMRQPFGTVFIATCFCPDCRARVQVICDFLDECKIRYVFGENFGGYDKISEGVIARIDASSLVIVMLTHETPSRWVCDEAVHAAGRNKPLILIRESCVVVDGLLEDREMLVFESNSEFDGDFIPNFMRKLNAVLEEYDLTVGLKPLGENVQGSAEIITRIANDPIGGECGNGSKALIERAKELTAQGEYEQALEQARRAAELYPGCWRAYTTMGGLLAKLGCESEANDVLNDVLLRFSYDKKACACALNNLGGILEAKTRHDPCKELLLEECRLFEESLQLDPDRLDTRASLAIALTRLKEVRQAERLIEDSLVYRGFPEAFLFELESQGLVVEILSKLPRWVERLLSGVRRKDSNNHND